MAGDLVGEPHAHFEIERIAHLRSIEAEHDNVVRRAFDEEGVRRGHGGLPMGWRLGSGLIKSQERVCGWLAERHRRCKTSAYFTLGRSFALQFIPSISSLISRFRFTRKNGMRFTALRLIAAIFIPSYRM